MPTQSSPALAERYQQRITAGDLIADPAQQEALAKLQALATHLSRPAVQSWQFWRKPVPALAGLYLWGDVGRGKSMLMDLFYDAIPLPQPHKRRLHFHRFMAEIHAALHQQRQERPQDSDPLLSVAQNFAGQTRLLCLDELQVSDITDAMILSRLFTLLFARGMTLVITSNRPPQDLYLNGLQRESFLPFIALLKQLMVVYELKSPTDYRYEKLRSSPVYFSPDNSAANSCLDKLRIALCPAAMQSETLDINGRHLTVQSNSGLAETDFATLCGQARGAEDYETLALRFHTIILRHVPQLTREDRNEAKRFVTLIDTLYEHHVKLLCSAATPIDQIYPVGDGSFEFHRTVSRLMEMQSQPYLASSHH